MVSQRNGPHRVCPIPQPTPSPGASRHYMHSDRARGFAASGLEPKHQRREDRRTRQGAPRASAQSPGGSARPGESALRSITPGSACTDPGARLRQDPSMLITTPTCPLRTKLATADQRDDANLCLPTHRSPGAGVDTDDRRFRFRARAATPAPSANTRPSTKAGDRPRSTSDVLLAKFGHFEWGRSEPDSALCHTVHGLGACWLDPSQQALGGHACW